MKAICKVSHEQMDMETGGFKRYEAGQIYDVGAYGNTPLPDEALFEIIASNPPLSKGETGGFKKGGKEI